jgi:hypothetical protein
MTSDSAKPCAMSPRVNETCEEMFVGRPSDSSACTSMVTCADSSERSMSETGARASGESACIALAMSRTAGSRSY